MINYDLHDSREGGGMPNIQIGKKYFLLKGRMVIGILVFEKKGAKIIAYYQAYPIGTKKYLSKIKDKLISMVFRQACEYFYKREVSIHLMPEAIAESDFRDSMWEIFKEYALPEDLRERIEEQAEKEYKIFSDSKAREQIEVLIELDPMPEADEGGKRSYVDCWEHWLWLWNPKK